ncbi:MAG: hypothetical protein IKM00_00635, partial [Clostridia bacterium]|nr:hypothetical protein [Clostridia bacterium]
KTHFCLPTKVRFLNEARLWRMKNEAGLRPMKCALRHMRMHGRDSLHVLLAERFMATATCCSCRFILLTAMLHYQSFPCEPFTKRAGTLMEES